MARGLGFVQPFVGEGDERFRGLGLGGALGNPVGERRTCRFSDAGAANALEQRGNRFGVGARQDECELVATDPSRVGAVTKHSTETIGEGPE